MYNLDGITFLTFVRIDNDERADNLKAMHSFYRKTCTNYKHIIIEQDDVSKVKNILELDPVMDVHLFYENDKEWRKCIGYNKGILLSETNIINLIDTDAIIHPKYLLETAEQLNADENAALMYPYNGMFLCTDLPLKEEFCNKITYDSLYEKLTPVLKKFIAIERHVEQDIRKLLYSKHGDISVEHLWSKGGCVMGRKDNLIKCNGYNPNFKGWGYEDDEMPDRATRLGFNVKKLAGEEKICWHLYHDDGTGSQRDTQPKYEYNKEIYLKVMNMPIDELKKYILTWDMDK